MPLLVRKIGYRCRYQVNKAPSVHCNALLVKSRSSSAHFFRLVCTTLKICANSSHGVLNLEVWIKNRASQLATFFVLTFLELTFKRSK